MTALRKSAAVVTITPRPNRVAMASSLCAAAGGVSTKERLYRVEVIADRPAPSIGCPFTPSTRSQHDERQGSVVAETCKVEQWRQESQPTRTATLLFKGIKAIR